MLSKRMNSYDFCACKKERNILLRIQLPLYGELKFQCFFRLFPFGWRFFYSFWLFSLFCLFFCNLLNLQPFFWHYSLLLTLQPFSRLLPLFLAFVFHFSLFPSLFGCFHYLSSFFCLFHFFCLLSIFPPSPSNTLCFHSIFFCTFSSLFNIFSPRCNLSPSLFDLFHSFPHSFDCFNYS